MVEARGVETRFQPPQNHDGNPHASFPVLRRCLDEEGLGLDSVLRAGRWETSIGWVCRCASGKTGEERVDACMERGCEIRSCVERSCTCLEVAQGKGGSLSG